MIMQTLQGSQLLDMKIDAMESRKIHADRNKLCPGKNGVHKPSGLGYRFVVLRQADKNSSNCYEFSKFLHFNCKAGPGCLNRYTVLIYLSMAII